MFFFMFSEHSQCFKPFATKAVMRFPSAGLSCCAFVILGQTFFGTQLQNFLHVLIEESIQFLRHIVAKTCSEFDRFVTAINQCVSSHGCSQCF